MRNISSAVRDPHQYVTCAGDRVHVILEPRFNGTRISLVEVGREDIQERIEAYAPFTDLEYMLKRLKVGDNSVLCDKRPLYGDFTGLPSDPISAINLVHSAENSFAILDPEAKQAYNNDYRVWLAAILQSGVASPASVGQQGVVSSVGVNDKDGEVK